MNWFDPDMTGAVEDAKVEERREEARKLLVDLADCLDELGAWSPKAHKFVCEMIERLAVNSNYDVSEKQLRWMQKLRDNQFESNLRSGGW